MSQVHVERVIGQLATDEALRRRFSKDPRAFLAAMIASGLELNECEQWSLEHLVPDELARFARAIGPRLQKADLSGGDE
jgi:hypothetical protein